MRFKNEKQRQDHENGLRGSYALRNSSPGEINARHQEAVRAEQRAKDADIHHKVMALQKQVLREIEQEKH